MRWKIVAHQVIEVLSFHDATTASAFAKPFPRFDGLQPAGKRLFQPAAHFLPRSLVPPTDQDMDMARIGRDKVPSATLLREGDLQLLDREKLRGLAKSCRSELRAAPIFVGQHIVRGKNSPLAPHESPAPIRHPTSVRMEREEVNRHRPERKLDVGEKIKLHLYHQ